MLHGPQPLISTLVFTATVLSWCQVTNQFLSGVLSKKMTLTISGDEPKMELASSINSLEFANFLIVSNFFSALLIPCFGYSALDEATSSLIAVITALEI